MSLVLVYQPVHRVYTVLLSKSKGNCALELRMLVWCMFKAGVLVRVFLGS